MIQKTFVEEPARESGEELLKEMRDQFSDVHQQVKKVVEAVDNAAAGLRMEMTRSAAEMTETRAHLARLQSRIDNQLMAMILANLASGVGVAALMLAASSAF